jgi:hypothetical protein
VLDLNRSWRIEATLLEEMDNGRHALVLARVGRLST